MKFLVLLFIFAVMCAPAWAGERIKLKDGRVLEGNIAAQYETGYLFQTEEGVERIEMSQIESIQFGPRLVRKVKEAGNPEKEVGSA